MRPVRRLFRSNPCFPAKSAQKTALFWISSLSAYNYCTYGQLKNARRGTHSDEREGGLCGRLGKIAALKVSRLAQVLHASFFRVVQSRAKSVIF